MKSLTRFLLFLFLVLVVLAGFVFTLKNNDPVPLWLFRDFAALPLSVWILSAFVLGGLSGLLLGFGLWRKLRIRLRLRQMQSLIDRHETEIEKLRRELKQERTGEGH